MLAHSKIAFARASWRHSVVTVVLAGVARAVYSRGAGSPLGIAVLLLLRAVHKVLLLLLKRPRTRGTQSASCDRRHARVRTGQTGGRGVSGVCVGAVGVVVVVILLLILVILAVLVVVGVVLVPQ